MEVIPDDVVVPPYDHSALDFLRKARSERRYLENSNFIVRPIRRTKKHFWPSVDNIRTFIMLLFALSTFLVLWRVAAIVTNCDAPLVVVLSGSMEPAFYRGDLLILHRMTPPVVGDIVVFSLPGRDIPIVHRIHRVHEDGGRQQFLTKGDNNDFDDRTLYPGGYRWLKEEHIIGKVALLLPNAGYLTLFTESRPILKVIVLLAAILWTWEESA